MRQTDFTVQVGSFTGPLDLLLDLIEKRKVFIGDVSLADVADDFVEHVRSMESFPIQTVAHFLVVASTLLLIKSRSLLPYLSFSEEESQDIAELEHRLALYKRMRELAQHVRVRFGKYVLFTPSARAHLEPTFAPHERLTIENLLAAARELIDALPIADEIPRAVVAKIMSLEEMIVSLTERIEKSPTTTFSEMAGAELEDRREQKLYIIVTFLALLELIKKGVVGVQQEGAFDDIAVAKV